MPTSQERVATMFPAAAQPLRLINVDPLSIQALVDRADSLPYSVTGYLSRDLMPFERVLLDDYEVATDIDSPRTVSRTAAESETHATAVALLVRSLRKIEREAEATRLQIIDRSASADAEWPDAVAVMERQDTITLDDD